MLQKFSIGQDYQGLKLCPWAPTMIFPITIFLAACGMELKPMTSSDSSTNNNTTDSQATTCGTPTTYPCGPYGIKSREVAANLEFVGFADPAEHCKDNKDKIKTINFLRKISFKDWYLEQSDTSSCNRNKKDLLWVTVSAGWCKPCQTEVEQIQQRYMLGVIDSRVGVLNVVFETTEPSVAADETFLTNWVKTFDLTFPVVMDPSFSMGAYFSKTSSPFNMLLETKTMQIYYQQTGANLDNIIAQINAYFRK